MIVVTDPKIGLLFHDLENIFCYSIFDMKEKWPEIKEKIKNGESLFYLGTENIDLLQDIWVFSVPGELSQNSKISSTGAMFSPVTFHKSTAKYLYIRPTKHDSMHGIDDEPRMEVIPLLSSYGKYGNLRGYPAILLKNTDESLTGGNYKGSYWFIFSLDNPLEALDVEDWRELLKSAAAYAHSSIYMSTARPEYPLYYADERVTVNYCVENRGDTLASYSVDIDAYDEKGDFLERIGMKESAVTKMDSCRDACYWFPKKLPNGVVTIRLTLNEHNRMQYGKRRENEFRTVDVVEIALLINTQPIDTPKVEVQAERFLIDGDADFFVGTHLYPSPNFFELSYRPVKVLELIRGIRAMKQTGVRLCRIWCDPVLDETSIRGMETIVRLLAFYDIAVDFMFFSSWVHYMEIHTEEYNTRFEVAPMTDEHLIGLYMHNMQEQKAFVTTLVKRWNDMRHIVWDFSNEFSVVDPDEKQLNVDFLDPAYKSLPKPYDSINLFEQWAMQINSSIRHCNNNQPVIFGVSCWDTGSENYRCSKKADLVANHGYYSLENMPTYLYLSNSACLKKPQIMEEFGGLWLDDSVRARVYDSQYHYLMGAGDSAAMNYEWGVLWLNDSLSGTPPYLKFKSDIPLNDLQDFVLEDRYQYGKSWPNGSTGVCPWMASFEYAITFGCMDYLSQTMIIMHHISNVGRNLGNVNVDKAVYLVLPFEIYDFVKNRGYPRYLERITKTVELLLTKGVNFKVWQEDMLQYLPLTAKVLIYPNELPIMPKQEAILNTFRNKGLAVYSDADDSWQFNPDTEKLSFTAADKTHVMLRDTSVGELVLITTLEETLSHFSIDMCGNTISFMYLRNASFLWDNGVRQADFYGDLCINNKIIARFEVKSETVFGKCLIRSNNGDGLNISKQISVFPCSAGRLILSIPYYKAEVVGIDGKVFYSYSPVIKNGETMIDLTEDDLLYEIRLTN